MAVIGRPSIITAAHLARLAIIYIRQSSLRQLIEHAGSTLVQRALADVARSWGFPETHIVTIDGDLGVSASRPGQRRGFRQMIDHICADRAGCVFLEDISRMSRNRREGSEFIDAVMEHGVPVYYSGRLFSADEEALGELLGLQVEVVVAEHDQKRRTLKMKRDREAKVLAGNAVSPPPVGYVPEVRGKWRKDPHEGVQLVLRLIFVLYLELRSTRKVADELRHRNLMLPRRSRGALAWQHPMGLSIVRLLKNANYTQDYFYRRTKVRVVEIDGKFRRTIQPQEPLVARDHHDGYVSREEFAAVQAILRRNRFSDQGPARGGPALLANLLTCACGRPLKTVYRNRGSGGERHPAYVCHFSESSNPMKPPRLRRCFWMMAQRLNDGVVPHVLETLTRDARMTPDAADIRAVLKEADETERDAETAQRAQVQAAEAAVRDLRRRYLAVNPDNDLVRVELEQELQEAMKRRDELCAGPRIAPSNRFSPTDVDEVVRCAGSICGIWNAVTTTDKDRQEILRAVIRSVTIASVTRERVVVHVEWWGGRVEPIEVVRIEGIAEAIAPLRRAGASVTAIAKELTARGVRGLGGKPLTAPAVYPYLRRLGLYRRVERREAAQRVRDLVLSGLNAQAILDELRRNGPRSSRGTWTIEPVRELIRHLRQGSYHGVEQLPAGPCSDNPVVRLMHRWRRESLPWSHIADELGRLGYRRRHGKPFTAPSCVGMYHEWRRQGWLARLLEPEKSPLFCPLKRRLAEIANARGTADTFGKPESEKADGDPLGRRSRPSEAHDMLLRRIGDSSTPPEVRGPAMSGDDA